MANVQYYPAPGWLDWMKEHGIEAVVVATVFFIFAALIGSGYVRNRDLNACLAGGYTYAKNGYCIRQVNGRDEVVSISRVRADR